MVVLLRVVLLAAGSSDQQMTNNASGMKTKQWANLCFLWGAPWSFNLATTLRWGYGRVWYYHVLPKSGIQNGHGTAWDFEDLGGMESSEPWRRFKDRTRMQLMFLTSQTKTGPLGHLSVQNSGTSWNIASRKTHVPWPRRTCSDPCSSSIASSWSSNCRGFWMPWASERTLHRSSTAHGHSILPWQLEPGISQVEIGRCLKHFWGILSHPESLFFACSYFSFSWHALEQSAGVALEIPSIRKRYISIHFTCLTFPFLSHRLVD